MTENMHRHLSELGSAPVPEPDAAFATHLELHLRATSAAASTRLVRPKRWPATVAALTFSLAVVAFGLATINPRQSSIRISAATGTAVHMPDGQVVVASPGLVIPEGSRVEVGPSGSARIGDVDVGPGQAADVTPEGIVLTFSGPLTTALVDDGEPNPATDRDPATDQNPDPNPVGPAGTTNTTRAKAQPATTAAVVVTAAPETSLTALGDEPPAEVTAAPTVAPTNAPTTGEPASTEPATTRQPTSEAPPSSQPTTVPPGSTTSATDATSTSGHPDATTTSGPTTTTSDTTSPTGATTTSSTTSATKTTITSTTQPVSSTTTAAGQISATSIVHPDEAALIEGRLRFVLKDCHYTRPVMIELTKAVIAGELTTEQAVAFLSCRVD